MNAACAGRRLLLLSLLLLTGCCCIPLGESPPLRCGYNAVWYIDACVACPTGSSKEKARRRISGRTSGADIRTSWCADAAGNRTGPYAETRDEKWIIEGGWYASNDKKVGPWTEWPSYGYGGSKWTGEYVDGLKDGPWTEDAQGKPGCTMQWSAGKTTGRCE